MTKRITNLLLALLILTGTSFAAKIERNLSYNKYTLKDNYYYGKVPRKIQWDKIEQYLDIIDNFERQYVVFGTLKNYKNINGQPPRAQGSTIEKHGKDTIEKDSFGVRRYQAIPLYDVNNPNAAPVRYALDGFFVMITDSDYDGYTIKLFGSNKEWKVPDKYLRELFVYKFPRVIVIDRKNQNIVTLEKKKGIWQVRSINPATTGLEQPPYKLATPLGVFVVQDKRERMLYLKDGSKTEINGFAPWATRFSGGGYIHGVPLVYPNETHIEYSWSLGTTPRSHMCVRNATSHAKYIYDWTRNNEDLIIVIE